MQDALGPIILVLVGLAIGIPSCITRGRHWPGLIAGFDEKRCSDVRGLTRWMGTTGMVMGIACLAAAGGFMVPRLRTATVIALAIVLLVGTAVSVFACSRFTRRWRRRRAPGSPARS